MWSLLEIRRSAARMDQAIARYFDRSYDVQLSEDVQPPPDEPEPPSEPKSEPKSEPAPAPPPPDPLRMPSPEPPRDPYDDLPAPAEAADVITRPAEEGGPVDLGWTIVDKDGSTSPGGGYTSARGTSKKPVRDPRARIGGKPDARPAPPPPKKNCRRGAGLVGSRSWSCPFPSAADVAQIDHATVLVSVSLDAAGRPIRVNVLRDPGYGFASAARRCALQKQYRAARDDQCRAIASTTPKIRVSFRR
jgi:protein TonB